MISSSSESEEEIIYDLPDIDPSLDLVTQVTQYPPPTWDPLFVKKLSQIEQIQKCISKERLKKYVPLNHEMFTPYRLCPLPKVKVVIIGQDPYQGYNSDGTTEAIGMCFSTRKFEKKIPPSLKKIFLEVKDNYPDLPAPVDGWLGHWARQGVLMINTFMTFHGKEVKFDATQRMIWDPIVNSTITLVKNANPYVVVMMWGGPAQKLSGKFGNDAKELKCGHPSPLNTSKNQFLGCKHFLLANKHLKKRGLSEIDWTVKH